MESRQQRTRKKRSDIKDLNISKDRQDRIDSVAADWAARLGGGPLSEPERTSLDQWLSESPAHGAAFEEARSAWAKMDALAASNTAAPSALSALGVSERRFSRLRSGPGFGLHTAAIAAGLLLAVGVGRFWFGDPYILIAADHRTAPGERAAVTLSDGSTVALGPASAVDIRYTEGERRIELLTGLAYFTVAPTGSSERPFIVESAHGSARALGTAFMVRRVGDAVEVTVAEHNVKVTRASSDRREEGVALSVGETVRYDTDGLGEASVVNLDHATAWRRGRLIVDRAPLSEVVTELNRYRRGAIVIANPDLVSRRVSGVFDMSTPEDALDAIIRELNINAAPLPPLAVLLY